MTEVVKPDIRIWGSAENPLKRFLPSHVRDSMPIRLACEPFDAGAAGRARGIRPRKSAPRLNSEPIPRLSFEAP